LQAEVNAREPPRRLIEGESEVRATAIGRTAIVPACLAALAVPATAQTPLEQLDAIAVIDQKVMVPMRDGIRLSTDIYRPKSGEPVGTIFVRTPYNFNPWRDGELQMRGFFAPLQAVQRGYAYVVQNERGRYFSEGEWDILGPPKTDGYDMLTWIANQPWSNGKVGTIGCSSTAEWQMGLAALDHPAHAAMIPQGSAQVSGASVIGTSRATGTGVARNRCCSSHGCMACKTRSGRRFRRTCRRRT
jgi:predicted acyl esterase